MARFEKFMIAFIALEILSVILSACALVLVIWKIRG